MFYDFSLLTIFIIICTTFRFGSEIETDDGQKTKCVMARIKIYTKDGAESRVRPISDR